MQGQEEGSPCSVGCGEGKHRGKREPDAIDGVKEGLQQEKCRKGQGKATEQDLGGEQDSGSLNAISKKSGCEGRNRK
jgi:hypothetical protein